MARTVYGDHERFKEVYFSRIPGMYFTGDGAKKDEDGYYWIIGRIDDVINVSGHRLGTAEIESALVLHPMVAEAAVVGYPHPIKGQGIYAFVTLNSGVQASRRTEERTHQTGEDRNRAHCHHRCSPVRFRAAQNQERQNPAPHPSENRRRTSGGAGRRVHDRRPGGSEGPDRRTAENPIIVNARPGLDTRPFLSILQPGKGETMALLDKNKGWTVTFAGTGINLAFGILYTWSIFKAAIKQSIETGGTWGFQLGPGFPQRSLCGVLHRVRVRHDAGRQVSGSGGASFHRPSGRRNGGTGIHVDIDDNELPELDSGVRSACGHRHRLRLFRRDASRAQMVSLVQNRPHCRPGGRRVRAGFGLHCTVSPIIC